MKGYKYRDIDNFERDLNSIINNQIYASPFIDLNDPFEAICNEKISDLAKLIETIFKIDSKGIIDQLNQLMEKKDNIGIYSLSDEICEELMWAHYASSHKGFCLEYNVPVLKGKHLAPEVVTETKVAYASKPQILTHEDIYKIETFLKKLFATKSKSWKYERETRLIFDAFGLKDYHSSALTGVYFGTRLESDKRQYIIDSLTNRDVRFYEMFRDKNSYKLKYRFVHENKRVIKNIIPPDIYEILSTSHNPSIEVFHVFYKGDMIDEKSLILFVDGFKEKHSIKNCNVMIYDDKSIKPLIDKYPLDKTEYLRKADHLIAMSNYELPEEIDLYPLQNFQYREYGGTNWKRASLI